jgi:type I restriction enzyme, R subunit
LNESFLPESDVVSSVNNLFSGELSDEDKLTHVNHVINGRLLKYDVLRQQVACNKLTQFSNSPDLAQEILNAVIDALVTHPTMSKQFLDYELMRSGLKLSNFDIF